MNYKQTILACSKDLMTVNTNELKAATKHYDIEFVNKEQACNDLAVKFMSPFFFKKAQMPFSLDRERFNKIITEYLENNGNIFIMRSGLIMLSSDDDNDEDDDDSIGDLIVTKENIEHGYGVMDMLWKKYHNGSGGKDYVQAINKLAVPENVQQFIDNHYDLLEEGLKVLKESFNMTMDYTDTRTENELKRDVLIALIFTFPDSDIAMQQWAWGQADKNDLNKYWQYVILDKDGELSIDEDLSSIIKLTDENADWLLPQLIKYGFSENDAETILSTYHTPRLASTLLENFPDIPFSTDWFINAVYAEYEDDSDQTTEWAKVILAKYGQPSENDLRVIESRYKENRDKPSTKALAELLGINLYPYKTKSEVMQAMAQGKLTRSEGMKLMQILPATLATTVVAEEDCNVPEKHASCTNDRDYISQECWSKDFEPDIKIKFLDPNDYLRKPQTLCIRAQDFYNIVENPANKFAAWYPNDSRQSSNKEIDAEGYGGKPSKVEHYIKLPPNIFVTNTAEQMSSFKGDYTAYPLYVQKRLGNIQGIFGIGQLHGQEPGFTIYYIVPDIAVRRRPTGNRWKQFYNANQRRGLNKQQLKDEFNRQENDVLRERSAVVILNSVKREVNRINELKGIIKDLTPYQDIKKVISATLDKDTIPFEDRITNDSSTDDSDFSYNEDAEQLVRQLLDSEYPDTGNLAADTIIDYLENNTDCTMIFYLPYGVEPSNIAGWQYGGLYCNLGTAEQEAYRLSQENSIVHVTNAPNPETGRFDHAEFERHTWDLIANVADMHGQEWLNILSNTR